VSGARERLLELGHRVLAAYDPEHEQAAELDGDDRQQDQPGRATRCCSRSGSAGTFRPSGWPRSCATTGPSTPGG